jgi:hypothetical protein
VNYKFTVGGIARGGQTWAVEGKVEGPDHGGGFNAVVQDVMGQSFQAITEGRAVYGRPAETCQGPYQITKLLVEKEDQ